MGDVFGEMGVFFWGRRKRSAKERKQRGDVGE